MRLRVRAAICAVLLLLPVAASAQEGLPRLPAVGDVVFKGVVGKALDAVPMDPNHRVALQRSNAVFSNTLTGRSLAVWAGLANPLLLIGGLAWGLFSASNIKAEVTLKLDTTLIGAFACIEDAQEQLTLLDRSVRERPWPAVSFKDQW